MIPRHLINRIISSALAAVWVAALVTGTLVLLKLSNMYSTDSVESVSKSIVPSAVTRALQPAPSNSHIPYIGNFDTPFKTAAALMPVRQSNGPAYARKTLVIKGVLIKERPLAIFASESGEKLIGGVGDTVMGQIVTAISGESVTLRDRQGTYTLTAEPK